MPRRPKEEPEEEEFEEEEEEEGSSPSRSAVPRMSITLPQRMRKKVRLAAALADLDPNEWCRVVLTQAARKTVEKFYPDKV